jgi:hypothetical protein
MSVWTPPPGLDVPAPRRVGMSTTSKGLILLMFALFSLPLALIAPTEISRAHKIAALKDHGVEVAAHIDRQDEQTTRHGTNYIAAYHYSVDQPSGIPGSSFSGEGRTSWLEYVKISVGGKIPVVYDAHNPGQSTTKTQLNEDGGAPYEVLIIFLPLFVGIPIAMTGFVYFKSLRERRLLQWGNVVPAKIVGEEEYSAGRGMRLSRLTYEFKDSSGALVTGTQGGVPTNGSDRSAAIELRARFCINSTAIYDPQNSARNMLYPPSASTLL